MQKLNVIGLHAIKDLAAPLRSELAQEPLFQYGDVWFAAPQVAPIYWAQNVWHDPVEFDFSSIKDAATKLRSLGRNWAHYPTDYHRRAALITENLPKVRTAPLEFPSVLPTAPMGAWLLKDEHSIIAAPHCSHPLPHGEVHFIENKIDPPNRAYLKLWEAFTMLGARPKPGDVCLDLGASPGGWSWVLLEHGAKVHAIDRTPLEPKIMRHPNLHFRPGDAFSVKPADFDHIDWLCCDVICYPEKLFEFVSTWLQSGKCRNFICTLKFQSDEHYGAIKSFARIPGSRLVHLYHNKHEVTWAQLAGDRASS